MAFLLRFKARFVATGFTRRYGEDYLDTYAPVFSPEALRTLLAIAAHLDLELETMDVDTTFLYADVQRDIYVQQPEMQGVGLMCKLGKALYASSRRPASGTCCWTAT